MTATQQTTAAAWYLLGFGDGIRTSSSREYLSTIATCRVMLAAKNISDGQGVFNPLDIYDMVEAAKQLGFPG